MAIASLIIGILAILFALIPMVGAFISIPLSVVAIILGAVARRSAISNGVPTGTATGGLVLGVMGIVTSVMIFASCVFLANHAAIKFRDDPAFRKKLGESVVNSITKDPIIVGDMGIHPDDAGNLLITGKTKDGRKVILRLGN